MLAFLLHFACVVDDAKRIVVTAVCVCLCVCVFVSGPAVAHCWADLQSVHGFRCYDNSANAKCQRVLVLALCLVYTTVTSHIHRVKWCHSNLWSPYDLWVVGQHGVHCVKLSGEDLSRYLNKIEISCFKKMSVLSLTYYGKKMISQ